MLTLSPKNPVIAARLDQQIAAGNAALTGAQAGAIYALANNSTDTALARGDGNRCWMMAQTAYGFGKQDSTADQGFTFSFTSTVAGTCYIAIRVAVVSTTSGVGISFGDVGGAYTGATGNLRVYTTALNGTTAPYVYTGLPNGLADDNDPNSGYFGWESPSSSNSSLVNVSFPVVEGTNTITFLKGTDYRCAGLIAEQICVWLAADQNWKNSTPNLTPMPLSYNLAPVTVKLSAASGRVVNVLWLGDSLAEYAYNWCDTTESLLAAKYGAAGRHIKLGSTYPDASGGQQWGSRSGVNFTSVTVTGGSDYLGPVYGTDGLQWAQATTGTLLTASNTNGSTTWEVLYACNTSGGSFVVSVNNSGTGAGTFSTAGTAGNVGIVRGTWPASAAGNTITISKTDTTSAGGVAILSVACGGSTGIRSSRLGIPGRGFATNGATKGIFSGDATTGSTAAWASYLAAMNFDLIVMGSANNGQSGLGLAAGGQALQNFLTTLTDSVSASYTKLLLADLHSFVNTNPFTAVSTIAGGSAIAFPPFPANSSFCSNYFNNCILDLKVSGGLARDMSFVSLNAYLGKDQVSTLYDLSFYNGTTGYSSDTNAAAVTDWHWNQGDSGKTVAFVGSILAGIITGGVPSASDVSANPIAVAASAGTSSVIKVGSGSLNFLNRDD